MDKEGVRMEQEDFPAGGEENGENLVLVAADSSRR
jgi:hypothetical protein